MKISESGNLEIFRDSSIILEQYIELLKTANSSVNLLFPTLNAYFRHRKSGIFELLSNYTKNSNIKVKVLLPAPRHSKELHTEIVCQFDEFKIEFRALDETTEQLVTFVVVDDRETLVMVLKDDTKNNFEQAIDSAIWANSSHIVSSYSSLFKTLWHQTELNEHISRKNLELQRKNEELSRLYGDLDKSFEFLSQTSQKLQTVKEEVDSQLKIQNEFINIAAHELRTPTQSIIRYCEMIGAFPEKIETYVEIIKRNAERLQNLASDILDVTKIEAGILGLQVSKI